MHALHQSALYQSFIRSLGWQTGRVDGALILYRHIPFVGGLAKIQRVSRLPDIGELTDLLKKQRIRTVALEPGVSVRQTQLTVYTRQLTQHGFRINRSAFLPTKTIMIDLNRPVETIFQAFKESKRRGVRRAAKNGVTVRESDDIGMLLSVKNRSAGLFGSITTYGIRNLWQTLAPAHATILLADEPGSAKPVGGILLLFWNRTAYYWIAGSLKRGKRLHAPTLLVWEALKRSRQQGCSQFDFVGVWDERFPKENTAWEGFTRFKEGFGGTTLYYPVTH